MAQGGFCEAAEGGDSGWLATTRRSSRYRSEQVASKSFGGIASCQHRRGICRNGPHHGLLHAAKGQADRDGRFLACRKDSSESRVSQQINNVPLTPQLVTNQKSTNQLRWYLLYHSLSG